MFFSFNILELFAFLKMKTTLAQFALIGAVFFSLRESQIGCVFGMLSVHADDLPKT